MKLTLVADCVVVNTENAQGVRRVLWRLIKRFAELFTP